VKAIETLYKGYRFRSRLEARWAVFFDALEIGWEYEPEGFELDDVGTRYLPDFRVESSHYPPSCWFEIKPFSPSAEEQRRASVLAKESNQLAFIFSGDPYSPTSYHSFNREGVASKYSGAAMHDLNIAAGFALVFDCPLQRVEAAQKVARGARFEFGEQG
jgi:hypothetical protein